jgi:hypothetical protein
MKLLEYFDRFKKKPQYINLHTVWKFAQYENTQKTELYFTDKTGSVIVDIPIDEFKKKMEETT